MLIHALHVLLHLWSTFLLLGIHLVCLLWDHDSFIGLSTFANMCSLTIGSRITLMITTHSCFNMVSVQFRHIDRLCLILSTWNLSLLLASAQVLSLFLYSLILLVQIVVPVIEELLRCMLILSIKSMLHTLSRLLLCLVAVVDCVCTSIITHETWLLRHIAFVCVMLLVLQVATGRIDVFLFVLRQSGLLLVWIHHTFLQLLILLMLNRYLWILSSDKIAAIFLI